MAKYKFVKEYTATGAGVRFDLYPKINRTFKQGEIVDKVDIDSNGFANGTIPPNSFAVRSNTGGSLPNGTPFTGIGILQIKDSSVLQAVDANANNNPNQPQKLSTLATSPTPLLTAVPFVAAGVGALVAYNKKFGVGGFILCIAGAFVVGMGAKNMFKYGNLIGWH